MKSKIMRKFKTRVEDAAISNCIGIEDFRDEADWFDKPPANSRQPKHQLVHNFWMKVRLIAFLVCAVVFLTVYALVVWWL